ncbi:MAG: FmdB family zinc ribbon protein [Actinomycetota bacterium]
MATYVFRCPECSEFDVVQPMSAVGPTHPCPGCGRSSRRVFTPPALNTTSAGLRRAADTAEASAEAPQVVRSIPSGPRRPSAPRWSPFTGATPVAADRRAPGPHQPLPKW